MFTQAHSSFCQEGRQPTDGNEIIFMHVFLLSVAFLMMVVLPCIVTMGAEPSTEEGDEF